jgi:hypothetical protein
MDGQVAMVQWLRGVELLDETLEPLSVSSSESKLETMDRVGHKESLI